ncbi:MAG: c-type cytochrome [Planctomycetes bacterium]|nr:c-type cytochrome [Planctomycetota bacterium]
MWTKAAAVFACMVGVVIAKDGKADDRDLLPNNVLSGWKVFSEKQCIQCHAIWNVGGQIGPDLGRIGREYLKPGQLAGIMWNHIPKMHSYMLRHHINYPVLSLEEVDDLFGFLNFIGYLEEPGDPAAGRRILREKGCSSCHSTEERAQQVGPDLKLWSNYANPILWAQKMWEHAPKMEREMKKSGMTWQMLAESDLLNIIAYVRSFGGHEKKVFLRPGSALAGKRLFIERKCQTCHHPGGSAKDFASATLPVTLTALASRMWNHSPEMTRMMEAQGVERRSLDPQEMADILAYITSLGQTEHDGDPQRGRLIFQSKYCVECHREQPTAGTKAPTLEVLASAITPGRFTHAMWNHGVTMMDRMSEAGIAWPVFQPGELFDLIAYLKSNSREAAKVLPASKQLDSREEAPAQAFLPPIEPGNACISNACHSGLVTGRFVHEPVAQGECNHCHLLLNPKTHQFTLQSNKSDLCYKCHDEPVETMAAHGPVAVGVCTACHNPHSAENAYGPNFTGSEMCFADIIGMTYALETLVGGKRNHGKEPVVIQPPGEEEISIPANLQRFVPSVPQTGSATIRSTEKPPASVPGSCIAGNCHVTLISGAVVHAAAQQEQCGACHKLVNEKDHRFELSVKEPALCYQCHDQSKEEAKFLHGPVGLGMCTPCHNPHSAPNKFMLPAAGDELCFTCHAEMRTHVKKSKVQHQVITDKGCIACHDPHRSNFKFQLKKDQLDLCSECHKETHDSINAAVVSHQPVTSEKKCANCHDPHGSDIPKILLDTEINLCLGCHNKQLNTPNGPIIDMKSWIDNNPEHHGPVRQSNCTGCHLPHGSKNFRILRDPFPSNFYQPFSIDSYKLCFECHEQTIVFDARTTSLTSFRNGDKNLHYLHVNQQKGRTCRACHEVHAGTKPKRIKDFVPFGAWKYPVNFELTENGGRCAPGCHRPMAYDRKNEIVNKGDQISNAREK